MTAWFVAAARNVGANVDWRLTSHETEDEAKACASRALSRGFRVEAGTAPTVGPGQKIGWRDAHAWAQSANDDAIMSLYRRLEAFAA